MRNNLDYCCKNTLLGQYYLFSLLDQSSTPGDGSTSESSEDTTDSDFILSDDESEEKPEIEPPVVRAKSLESIKTELTDTVPLFNVISQGNSKYIIYLQCNTLTSAV